MMKKLLALGLVLAITPLASATVIINDDFNSYADNTALDAVWNPAVGSATTTYLDLDPDDFSNQVVHQDATAGSGRRDQSFTPTTIQSWQEIVWQFDFYDFAGNTTGPRQYGQMLAGSGGLTELISMGQYNAAAPIHDNNKYQARVAFGGPNWFNLNTDRSVGWHTFTAVINPSTVDFYVDGVLDTAGVTHGGTDWYQARIGSGLSATADALFDNYSVELTPEPASFALIALGGLVALRRRR